ncbi:MAG: hypothetical protein KDA85_16115, partial [Planctomycetaceae bacterium]|nr:hypothetical protein [Planctomycetaceae bacterium]
VATCCARIRGQNLVGPSRPTGDDNSEHYVIASLVVPNNRPLKILHSVARREGDSNSQLLGHWARTGMIAPRLQQSPSRFRETASHPEPLFDSLSLQS